MDQEQKINRIAFHRLLTARSHGGVAPIKMKIIVMNVKYILYIWCVIKKKLAVPITQILFISCSRERSIKSDMGVIRCLQISFKYLFSKIVRKYDIFVFLCFPILFSQLKCLIIK